MIKYAHQRLAVRARRRFVIHVYLSGLVTEVVQHDPRLLIPITGSRLATDDDVLRRAHQSGDEPLPFIPPQDEKKQAELEKAAQAAANLPEEEKLRLVAEAARAEKSKDQPELDGKVLSEAAGFVPAPGEHSHDHAVQQVVLQERAATRLQQMEREIVIEKTLGE